MTPTSADYRLYIDERFKSLSTSMNAQFTEVHERLDDIKEQTTKTNGRVTDLEEESMKSRESLLQHSIACPKGPVIDKIVEDLEDYRFFKRYPKLTLLMVASFVIGLLFTMYTAYKTATEENAVQQMLKEMQTIRSEMQQVKN